MQPEATEHLGVIDWLPVQVVLQDIPSMCDFLADVVDLRDVRNLYLPLQLDHRQYGACICLHNRSCCGTVSILLSPCGDPSFL